MGYKRALDVPDDDPVLWTPADPDVYTPGVPDPGEDAEVALTRTIYWTETCDRGHVRVLWDPRDEGFYAVFVPNEREVAYRDRYRAKHGYPNPTEPPTKRRIPIPDLSSKTVPIK